MKPAIFAIVLIPLLDCTANANCLQVDIAGTWLAEGIIASQVLGPRSAQCSVRMDSRGVFDPTRSTCTVVDYDHSGGTTNVAAKVAGQLALDGAIACTYSGVVSNSHDTNMKAISIALSADKGTLSGTGYVLGRKRRISAAFSAEKR